MCLSSDTTARLQADSSDVEEPGKTAGLQHRTPAGMPMRSSARVSAPLHRNSVVTGSKAIFDVQSVAVGGDGVVSNANLESDVAPGVRTAKALSVRFEILKRKGDSLG